MLLVKAEFHICLFVLTWAFGFFYCLFSYKKEHNFSHVKEILYCKAHICKAFKFHVSKLTSSGNGITVLKFKILWLRFLVEKEAATWVFKFSCA